MHTTTIIARVQDQRLTLVNESLLASGSVGVVRIQFEFCNLWEGCTRTAVFYRDEEHVYHVLITDGYATVPPEVLADEGYFYFGVLGVDDCVRPTEVLRVKVVKGAITSATAVSDPTPDIYQQIVAQYNLFAARFNEVIALNAVSGGLVEHTIEDTYFTATLVSNGVHCYAKVVPDGLALADYGGYTSNWYSVPLAYAPLDNVTLTGGNAYLTAEMLVGEIQDDVRLVRFCFVNSGTAQTFSDYKTAYYPPTQVAVPEVTDMRVSASGEAYDIAGDALRAVEVQTNTLRPRVDGLESAFDITERVNLLNPAELVPGVDLGGSVEEDWGDGYPIASTGYIAATPGDVFTYQCTDLTTTTRGLGSASYMFYDYNLTPLSEASLDVEGAVTAPAGAAYVRFCLKDYNTTTEWAIVNGDEVVLYEDYAEVTHWFKYPELTAKPKNIYNPAVASLGYIVNQASGEVQADGKDPAENTATDFISVTPGNDYVLGYTKKDGSRAKHGTGWRYAFYDKNKEYIAGGFYNTDKFTYITAPENAAFVRCSYYCLSYFGNEVQFEEGTAPTEYEAFGSYAPPAVIEFRAELLAAAAALNTQASSISEEAGHGEINEVLAEANGAVMFPAGKTIELSKPIYMDGRENVILDFNGCTLIPSADFNTAATMPEGLNGNILFGIANCENIVVLNGVFDCDTINNGFGRFMGVECVSSSVTFRDCVFRNSNYHHIYIKSGFAVGENITFLDLQTDPNYINGDENADTSSDVYTGDANDTDNYVESRWRSIKSERAEQTGDKVFYFGVTDDAQGCYHSVDGLWSKNAKNTIELRGGEGYFKNIYAENVAVLISQHNGVTEVNAPIVTFDNVHLKNITGDGKAPICIYAARRLRLNNVLIEAPDFVSADGYGRAIDIHSRPEHPYPLRDVVISDVKYTGADLYCGVYVEGDVECSLENITIDAAASSAGLVAKDVPLPIKVTNFDCPNMAVNLNNATLKKQKYWSGTAWVEL